MNSENKYMLQGQVAELTLKTISEIEELAEEILTDRAQIIDYDKKRNDNREAINAIKDNPSKKQWFCVGNLFIKIPEEQAKQILVEDQQKIEAEMNKLRNSLKPKVKKLHELEGLQEVKGFDLKGMN